MTTREFKEKVYELYKREIDLISDASKTENHQDDIGVATDKFICFIDSMRNSIFVNIPKARETFEELRKEIED